MFWVLSVVGLSVRVEALVDGMMVLRCETSCPLSGNVLFIWKKNDYRIGENRRNSKYLILQNFTRNNEGIYSCAIEGHGHISSPSVTFCKSTEHMMSNVYFLFYIDTFWLD